MGIRPRHIAASLSAAALALTVGAATSFAASGDISHAEGVLTLDIAPGSAGITALDTACPGSQVTITGQGTGFTQVGESSQDTGAWTMSGGACAVNGVPSGLMVVTVDSPVKCTPLPGDPCGIDYGSHSCPTMTGSVQQDGAVVLFNVTGDCVINAWHTGPMTYQSVGLLTNGFSSPEIDQAVYFSEQDAAPCC